jgi:DNA/RNA endonuclease G (NUC1)
MRVIAALLLAFSFSAVAAPIEPAKPLSECKVHLPYGVPTVKQTNTTKICRDGYALEFDNVTKVPLWVAYTLTPEKAIGCFPRVGGFRADPSIRGTDFSKAYAKSGYDIGHMAPDSDMRWSEKSQTEASLYPNAAPQLPSLNRGSWKALEIRTRSYAVGGRTLQVVMGAVAVPTDKRLGTGPVVPRTFWKVLVDQKTGEVVSFIYPQANTPGSPSAFKKPMAEVLKAAEIKLPLPKGVKLDGPLWPVTASSISAKADACTLR